MIIGTAGHIDHGKTALVHALTGVDTDRLKEEKARGITIELGYAYQPLTNGDVLGFIDVPGHERFVHTMLSGAAGIDFALLVIAADDGVMPQTREHLEILDLLGVKQGAVALTKIDRVESKRVDALHQEIYQLLQNTRLQNSPIFSVSSVTLQGVDALKHFLREQAETFPARLAEGDFRLAIDRSFSLQGVGTVVTGTVFSGSISVGDEVIVTPSGKKARVRNIHAQNCAAESGFAGQRCALNLAGLEKDEIARGDWIVAPTLYLPTQRFDARVKLLSNSPVTLKQWSPLHLHLGAIDVAARVVLLEKEKLGPGESALVQIVPDQPIGTLYGDTFVLRDIEARHTLGNGKVLDIHAPARKRRASERLRVLNALEHDDPQQRLNALLQVALWGVDLTLLQRSWNLPEIMRFCNSDIQAVKTSGGQLAFSDDNWRALQGQLLKGLREFHEQNPDELGPNAGRARRMFLPKLSPPVFAAVVETLINTQQLKQEGASLHLPEHRIQLSAQDEKLAKRILLLLQGSPHNPPWVRDLAQETGVEEKQVRQLLKKMARQGMVYQVVKDLFYDTRVIHELMTILESMGGQGFVQAADFRDRIGLGRKRSIQILEFFDRIGYTRRVRDAHYLRTDRQASSATNGAR